MCAVLSLSNLQRIGVGYDHEGSTPRAYSPVFLLQAENVCIIFGSVRGGLQCQPHK